MIERVVEGLAAAGIDEAVLSLGYRPTAFLEAYPDDRCAGVRLHYAVEPEPLDTAGAIRFAAVEAGIDTTFLVLNGDVLTDLDVAALLEVHRRRGGEATIALTQVDDPSRFGVVPTDDEQRVLGFVEKPAPADAPTDWINAGTYVLEPSVIERIPSGRRVSIERETFPALVEDDALFAMRSDAYWVDAGTPEAYLQAQLDLVDGTRDREVPVHPSAEVAADAEVAHAVVMAGATVAPGARVVDAVVLPGASIGPGASVERSVVGSRATVGEGASLSELCVVGDGALVAAGEELAGVRRPESY
jgi:mannose-1-phosphate guanylyltransferase